MVKRRKSLHALFILTLITVEVGGTTGRIFIRWLRSQIRRNTFKHCCRSQVLINFSTSRWMCVMNKCGACEEFRPYKSLSLEHKVCTKKLVGEENDPGSTVGPKTPSHSGNEVRAVHLFIFRFTAPPSPDIHHCLFPLALKNNKLHYEIEVEISSIFHSPLCRRRLR